MNNKKAGWFENIKSDKNLLQFVSFIFSIFLPGISGSLFFMLLDFWTGSAGEVFTAVFLGLIFILGLFFFVLGTVLCGHTDCAPPGPPISRYEANLIRGRYRK